MFLACMKCRTRPRLARVLRFHDNMSSRAPRPVIQKITAMFSSVAHRSAVMGAVSWKSRLCMIGIVYSSLGCLICEYRQDCTAPNKVSCRQSKNYDLQSVCSTCSTCKNVQYMCRTFSVAVSVAVMLLKKGSV